jgi:putative transferase (TIGR04331 family)
MEKSPKKKILFYPNKSALNEKSFYVGNWMKFLMSDNNKNNSIFVDYENYENFEEQSKIILGVRNLSEEILMKLSVTLNKIHGIEWSLRSWKFLLGPWLEIFVAVICDRIKMSKALLKKNNFINGFDLEKGKNVSLISQNYREFTSLVSDMDWNEKLLLRLLYIISKNNLSNETNLLLSKKNSQKKKKYHFEELGYRTKNFIFKIVERCLCSKNEYLFYKPNIGSKIQYLKISKLLNQIPFFYSSNFLHNKTLISNVDLTMRKKIEFNFKYENFEEKIVIALIQECLPTIYLEGFKKMNSLADSSYLPNKIRVIISKSVLRDNIYKFWVAKKINEGAKLVLVQHGGGYGYKKLFQNEDYEIAVSDKYFSWGWNGKKKVVPIGNISLSKRGDYHTSNNKSLLIMTGLNRIFKIDNNLFSVNDLIGLKNNIDFLTESLNSNLFDEIKVREHPIGNRKFSFKFADFVKKSSKKLNYLDPKKNLAEQIDNSSIVITTYDSSEFLNMITMNKPCFQIFNKKFISEEKLSKFNALYECGIIHENGRTLAKKINELDNGIYNWWNSNGIKKKREDFFKEFNNTEIDYNHFVNELKLLKI